MRSYIVSVGRRMSSSGKAPCPALILGMPPDSRTTVSAALSTEPSLVATYTLQLVNPLPVVGNSCPAEAVAGSAVPATLTGAGAVAKKLTGEITTANDPAQQLRIAAYLVITSSASKVLH